MAYRNNAKVGIRYVETFENGTKVKTFYDSQGNWLKDVHYNSNGIRTYSDVGIGNKMFYNNQGLPITDPQFESKLINLIS